MNGDEVTPTPPPQIDEAEITRLRELAAKFSPLADALEADPSKYFQLQGIISGATPPQQNTPPAQQQDQKLTPEQIRELNQRAAENPAQFMAEMAMEAARRAQAETFAQATPLLATTADLVIEQYKNGKAAADPLYKQIVPYFDKELRDVGRNTLIGMQPVDRMRVLELRWSSAANSVFRKAAAERQNAPPPTTVSGGNAGSAAAVAEKKTGFQKDPLLAGLSEAFGFTPEEIAQINKELEDEE
jgi:hypothetical protein